MTKLDSQNHEKVLERVQALVGGVVPEALCEFWDYRHRIRCGTHDQWGNTQEVSFVWRGQTEDDVLHLASVLDTKVRTGGSTAA